MPKKSVRNAQKQKAKREEMPVSGPWIGMRTGLIIMAIVSLGMAVLTAIQAIPQKGTLQGILWGLFFGGLIWVIFFGFYFFNRWLRR